MSLLSKKNHSSKAGFSTLVLVFYLMFIFVSLAGAMATVVLVSKRQYATNLGARKAYYGAESYINRTLFKVMVGGDWPSDQEIDMGTDRIVIRAVKDESFTISHTSSRAKRTLEVSKSTEQIPITGATDILLTLDCSGSMSKHDRMERAKGAIDGLLKNLKSDEKFKEKSSLGLWTFEVDQRSHSGDVLLEATDENLDTLISKIASFSNDPNSQSQGTPGEDECRGPHTHGSTNTSGAAGESARFLKDYEDKRAVVIITDGEPNTGILNNFEGCDYTCTKEDYRCEDKALPSIRCVTDVIKDWENFRIYVVMIASEGEINEDAENTLKYLATSAGKYEGGYFFTENAGDLSNTLLQIKDEILTEETFHLREVEPEAD